MPRFLIYHPGEDTRVFELIGDRPISIGRAKSSNLVLDNASISRLHAVVRATQDGKWEIIDRGSANGVRVNGTAKKEAALKPNDEVILGEYRLRYFDDSSSREAVSYGTPQLPPRVATAISQSAYSASFMAAQPVSNVTTGHGIRPPSDSDRKQAAEHENRLMTLLNRVNRTLEDLKTVPEVTQKTLDLVLEMDGAERGFVMLLDKDSIGGGDFSRGGYGFEPALIRYRAQANASQGQGAPQLTISQSIIKQVMFGGLPLLVTDPQADPRLAASKSIVAAGIQSAMCAPLGKRERRFGLLYVDNLSRRGMFTVDDLNVFTVIAAQAGLAIDRVRPQGESAEHLEPSTVKK
ncbi:MAG TPA: FHA domain-containing protein [Candidatus Acidoferrales bacterium]|nr:FHA domain-containing protein [Candidatus Acidoferrales bacterium]